MHGEETAVAAASGIDLNLLVVLDALLEERNVTRAGARLSLSQSTMSGALARLRQHFGDELLVRSGREYRLTPVAGHIVPGVREALHQVERTLSAPPEFDPGTSTRRFLIAICGHSDLVLGELLARVRELAPRVRLETWSVSATLLDADRAPLWCDLLLAPAGPRPAGPHSAGPRPAGLHSAGLHSAGEQEVIWRDRFVYVADPANPRLRDGRLSLADLAAAPHAAARLPHGQPDPAAAALAQRGITPDVVVTTSGWLALPFLVSGTDLVAAVPERIAGKVAAAAGTTVIDPPFGPIELAETAWWHPMRATDPALTWLRATLKEALGR
jgi:DNA-binding transcriptional LysR family regulator